MVPLLPLLLACGSEPAGPPAPILLPEEEAVPAVAPASGEDPGEAPAQDEALAQDEAPAQDLGAAVATAPPPTPERAEAYAAHREKTVVELQQWREATSLALPEGGTVTLMDLNPWVHRWLLVQVDRPGRDGRVYHLENHAPDHVRAWLDPDFPDGLVLSVDGEEQPCPLWTGPLDQALTSGRTYAPLCDGHLSLRNPTVGRRSAMESTTDFLRDRVWGGEKITTLVRDTVYKDSELATSEPVAGRGSGPQRGERFPARVRVDPAFVGQEVVPVNLGLPLVGAAGGTVAVGRWYPVANSPGAFVAAMQPRFVAPDVAADWGAAVHPLDEVEASALAYFVAFDLDAHELRFDTGTDHPRVGWSERSLPSVRDARLPGPDGFDKIGPLVRTGKVNPAQLDRLVATFTGGFKRSHGAFKHGSLALQNQGSHYGWVEHGVVESRPRPGLATLVVDLDGTVDLRVWEEADDAELWRIVHLRQNGVPLLVEEEGTVRPGSLVTSWGAGNWSGSVDGKLRSVRASLCVQDGARLPTPEGEAPTGRFLVYGYFTSATPSAMSRTLAAVGCGTAMLTDMNALEHTYLSLHQVISGEYQVSHLDVGMAVLDKEKRGVYLPRFVGLADNRDFFTVLRREAE